MESQSEKERNRESEIQRNNFVCIKCIQLRILQDTDPLGTRSLQSPEECLYKTRGVAVCLKLPSNMVSEIMKTHPEDAALEAVISKWAEDEKKACRHNIVQALGCMKNMTLAIQMAVKYGFGPR